jgi:hypothetical protein
LLIAGKFRSRTHWLDSENVKEFGVSKEIYPLFAMPDDFARQNPFERKETLLCKVMTKCRYYSCPVPIARQIVKNVTNKKKRQAKGIVFWALVREDDFHDVMKEIEYFYNEAELWTRYRDFQSQCD